MRHGWKNAIAQWMRSRVSIFDDDVDNIEMIKHDAIGSVCFLGCRIVAESENGHDCGNDRGVVDITVECCVVRAVIHGVEYDFQLDGL